MSLASQVSALATRIGTEFKTLRSEVGTTVGTLGSLTTTNKTNLVSAINEVKAGSAGAPPSASETQQGVVELATTAEAAALSDTARAVTPAGLGVAIAGKANTSSLAAVALSGNFADMVGTLSTAQLPALAINDTFPVASQAAMLALTAQRGDIAIRTDQNRSYILTADAPSVLGNWTVLTAGGDVTSVAGKTGAVTLVKGDVGLGNVDNTSDANKPVSTATQTALNAKADLASPTFTGTPTLPSGTLGLTKTTVGLGNVDNTSDANKPVSTAQAAADALRQPINTNLTSLSGLTLAADRVLYSTAVGTLALATFTAAGRSLVAGADAAAQRATLSVYSTTEVGDPTTDFVAQFNAAIV